MIYRRIASKLFWPFDRGLARVGYFAVKGYRSWISPRKGFKCAVGALTSNPSCSDVAIQAFREQTFTEAVLTIRTQFVLCRNTYNEYSKGLINSANSHLSQFSTIAAVGVIGCCSSPEERPGPLGGVEIRDISSHSKDDIKHTA